MVRMPFRVKNIYWFCKMEEIGQFYPARLRRLLPAFIFYPAKNFNEGVVRRKFTGQDSLKLRTDAAGGFQNRGGPEVSVGMNGNFRFYAKMQSSPIASWLRDIRKMHSESSKSQIVNILAK